MGNDRYGSSFRWPEVYWGFIRPARKSMGLSLKKLGQQIDVSESFMQRIERGKTIPNARTYIELLAVLNIDKIPIDKTKQEQPL
jgi:transcriptional regulator with XRE-family HTH domain